MAGFGMCPACAAEYDDPADRRFHAQPTCCPACGPRLTLTAPDGSVLADAAVAGWPADPVARAAALLAAGRIVAVKGLGGYHLAAVAASEAAASALRQRKHREDKPFAVMVADLAAARRLGQVSEPAAALLASPRRPIVLLPRRDDAPVAAAVAPGNRAAWADAPVHPAASPAAPRPGRAVDPDQRERLGRADRLRRRRRAGAAGRDRRRVPGPRPGHPHPDRRLGCQGAAAAGRRYCAGPAATCPSRCRSRLPSPGPSWPAGPS